MKKRNEFTHYRLKKENGSEFFATQSSSFPLYAPQNSFQYVAYMSAAPSVACDSVFHLFASNCRKCAKIRASVSLASPLPHPTYDENRATGNRSIDEHLKKSWYFHKYLTPNTEHREHTTHAFAQAAHAEAFSDDNIFKYSFVRHRISLQFCSLNWTSWENGVVLLLLVRLFRAHVGGKDDVRSILLISRVPRISRHSAH